MTINDMPVLTTVADCRAFRAAAPGRVAAVYTMGALHEGHLSLVREAQRRADTVIVSIFVNPLQFGAGEDLDAYPRTLERDCDMLRNEGVDAVFAPSAAEMYPGGAPATTVVPGALADRWEGTTRPGHFAGVLTVVAKLLHITSPHVSVFGRKDAQQVACLRRMVIDLNIDVEIVAADIARDSNGLALSSRNAYLSESEYQVALVLGRALNAARDAAGDGALAALTAGRAVLDAEPGIRLDYFALVDTEAMLPVADDAAGHVQAIVAAWVGTTRLIDNALFTVSPPAA